MKKVSYVQTSFVLGYTKVFKHPQSPTTSRNQPQPATTIRNHPQPSTTTHNHPQPSKSWEEYIFNKRYNHDTVNLVFEALSKIFQCRVFIFEESLTNSPRGIVGEKYNRCINVLKKGDPYNLIVVNEKGCEKANNRLHNLYSRSVLLFHIFFIFIFTAALSKRC